MNVRGQVRTPVLIALVAFLAILIAKILPLFGIDLLGAAVQSSDRSTIALMMGVLVLWLVTLIGWRVYRWRHKSAQGFPWWSVTANGLIIVVLVFAYARYAGELGP